MRRLTASASSRGIERAPVRRFSLQSHSEHPRGTAFRACFSDATQCIAKRALVLTRRYLRPVIPTTLTSGQITALSPTEEKAKRERT
jgi:hypothetical protein